MTDWQKVYAGLRDAGFTDDKIATIGRLSRNVINRVRNGTYKHQVHEPGHAGGQALLNTVTEAIRLGVLDYDPLAEAEEPSEV